MAPPKYAPDLILYSAGIRDLFVLTATFSPGHPALKDRFGGSKSRWGDGNSQWGEASPYNLSAVLLNKN